MSQWAIVTGATAGIGKSTATLLAKNNWNLILTGRRDQRLRDVKQELENNHSVKVETLSFDVSDRKACESVFKEHADLFSKASTLINNAGLARGVDPVQTADLDDWDDMINTNVKGLLYVTRLALPFLQKNTPAHIVNIGSVAGRWTYQGAAVYCSTKHSVRAISEGLRMDLNGQDIRVTNICPGMVETEFSEVRLGDKEKAKQVYAGMKPLTAEDIAECVTWSLNRPKHVNIQEIVVFPTEQASVSQVHRS